ncbi:hypothetical protein [Actinacidiphila glaucinigra]|uniref:hypothetical protein n=1 Tax=Actinacidiphila glaucinigra TaxID=235986 RepID=UPI003711D4AE
MTSDTSTRRHAKRRRTGLTAAAGGLVVAGSVAVISLDRQHTVGYDNVVGPSSATVSGMPWDPADGWDREHFMALVGAPAEGRHGVGPSVPW